VRGLPEIATIPGLSFLAHLDATPYLPSFVTPYFAYFRDQALGDAAARAAWRASIGPLIVIVGVVVICLILAHFSKRDAGASSEGDTSATGGREANEGERPAPEMPAEATGSVSFHITPALSTITGGVG
jgi:hypothetical protein